MQDGALGVVVPHRWWALCHLRPEEGTGSKTTQNSWLQGGVPAGCASTHR